MYECVWGIVRQSTSESYAVQLPKDLQAIKTKKWISALLLND